MIFADSGLLELIQLIYPGSTTAADGVLTGGAFDKAIRAYLIIDAALTRHALPDDVLTAEETEQMKNIITKMSEERLGADFQVEATSQDIVKLFQQRISDAIKGHKAAGRTPALWCLFHDMVDTIKISIEAERTGNLDLHLACISERMLPIFAAAGHH